MFLKRHSIFILFIALEGLAIGYFLSSTGYTRARAKMSAARVTGGANKIFTSTGDYFTLRHHNEMLRQRVSELENELALRNVRNAPDSMKITDVDMTGGDVAATGIGLTEQTAQVGQNVGMVWNAGGGTYTLNGTQGEFFYSPASVISNSTARQHNYFVIDRGRRSGVEENMAVVSIDGYVAGYVQLTSENFAVCMSVLNRDFRIGGKIKGKDYFGSIYWDGLSPRFVTLSDIPRYAPVEVGDTILSSYSLRFPQGSRIGVVHSFREAGDGTYFEIKVKLGMNMDKLSDVLLIKFRDSDELSGFAGEHFPDNK